MIMVQHLPYGRFVQQPADQLVWVHCAIQSISFCVIPNLREGSNVLYLNGMNGQVCSKQRSLCRQVGLGMTLITDYLFFCLSDILLLYLLEAEAIIEEWHELRATLYHHAADFVAGGGDC